VSLGGGAPVPLAKSRLSYGVTWGVNGSIVFAERIGGLKVIAETGGEPKPFTELDTAAHEVSHRLPHFLPDGSAVLFTVIRYKEVTPNWTQAQIWVKSIRTGERKLILENALDARYAGNGWLVFARLATLYAVRFDPVTLTPSGSPVPILEGVLHSIYWSSAQNTSGAAAFSISDTGALLYAPGTIDRQPDNELVWVDRNGTITAAGIKPRIMLTARISPDESRILFNEYSVNADVWSYDRQRGGEARHTSDGQNAFPIWSPDGSRIAFRSDRTGPARIYVARLNSLDAQPITAGPLDVPGSWTAKTQELAFVRTEADGNTDIYVVSVDQPDRVRAVVATKAAESYPEFSPDGTWLAYVSSSEGRPGNVFVQPYPGPGDPIMISTDGASEPAWSRDGSEIFYRSGQAMFSVRVHVSGNRLVPAKPVELFRSAPGVFGSAIGSRHYDVTRDGRFLMRRTVPESAKSRNQAIYPTTLRVILNWTDEFRRNAGK
jgi:hypothetical protein